MVREASYQVKEDLYGPNGPVYFYHVISEEEFLGKGRMIAKIVIPKGSAIGIHTHEGETEPYYILKGKGDFTNPDGSVQTVGPGDCCIINPGESHGIANPYDEDLEFMAIIYYE